MINEEKTIRIEERTFQFALMIIDIYKFLCMEKKSLSLQSNCYEVEHLLVLIFKRPKPLRAEKIFE